VRNANICISSQDVFFRTLVNASLRLLGFFTTLCHTQLWEMVYYYYALPKSAVGEGRVRVLIRFKQRGARLPTHAFRITA